MDGVSLAEIFLLVLVSSLFSFGGGNGAIPFIQGRWVETGRLAPELFSFTLAITYLSPGPRVAFLAGVGYYLADLPGAVVAVLGALVPTCLGAAAVSAGLDRVQSVVARLAPSAMYVIAGLIAATAWGLARPLALLPVEMIAVAAAAILVAWRNVAPLKIMLLAGGVGLAWSLLAGQVAG